MVLSKKKREWWETGFSAEARAFFDAVDAAGGSLTDAEKDAIDVFVLDAMGNPDAWWDNMVADWPYVGSSLAAHQINLKTPGTFDLIFVNTLSGDHTTNGWQPNATDSYARTGVIPSVDLTLNDVWTEVYSRTEADIADGDDLSGRNGISQNIRLTTRSNGNSVFDCYNGIDGDGRVTIAQADGQGGFAGNRRASNSSQIFKDGFEIDSGVGSGGTVPTFEIYLGARNNAGTAGGFSNKEQAGASIGTSLTDAQALAQYTARQTLNTSLGRQV